MIITLKNLDRFFTCVRWGMIKPAIFQKHGASINRSIQRAINLVRRSTAINTSRPRSVYLPLILISNQMNTEKWNMNIHFHVHQPRSSSKHVLAIQILSVRQSVCLSHAGIVSKRLNMLSSPHDSPFILVLCVSRYSRNSDGVTPCGGAKYSWGIKICAIFYQ